MENIFSLFPLIMQAINLAPKVITALKTGGSVISVLQEFGPDAIDLLKGVGKSIWPDLTPENQVQAAALKVYDIETVKFVQDALNKLGASPQLVVDGSYGKMTKAAVTAFQTKLKVEPSDGWAGAITQAALHNEVNKLTAAAPKAA